MIPWIAALLSLGAAAEPPVDTGLEERVQVTLIQVDVFVVDEDGRTVPGLTKDDFTLEIAGEKVPIEALDALCPEGATDDPLPLRAEFAEAPAPIGSGDQRKMVFAFDYTFLSVTMRPQVLEAAERMLRASKAPDEEVMIVALADEVRVEQRFTKDVRLLAAALERMGRDVTLWARQFPIGVSGESYFNRVQTLMDVLEVYGGPKAVIYFSEAGTVPAAMTDLFYDRVAAHASAGRVSIYPTQPNGLTAGHSGTLVRFANETGGRLQPNTNDMSLAYRRAQRDLSCRYTLAARIDANETRDPRRLRVKLTREGLEIRAPESVQVFSDAAKRRSRAAAAYVDPGPFERPLVRAFAFPAIPASGKGWDTLLAVSFPAPVRAQGSDVDLRAVVRKDHRTVDEYKRRIHLDPPAAGEKTRPVTVLGNARLEDGSNELIVVLGETRGEDVAAARTAFVVPQVVSDVLMLRGPVMGRVAPGGSLFLARPKDRPQDTRIGKILGKNRTFEPLLVQEIAAKDELLFYWSACVVGTSPIPAGAVVSRRVVTTSGRLAKAFDDVPLTLTDRGKRVWCLDMLETIPGGTLAAGEHRLEVVVAAPGGAPVALGSEPITVR